MVRSIYEKWCVPFSFLCYTKHSVNLKGETDNGKKKCMEDIQDVYKRQMYRLPIIR